MALRDGVIPPPSGCAAPVGLIVVLVRAPTVDPVDLDDRADAGPVPVRVRLALIVLRQGIDIGETLVVVHAHNPADGGDVGVPVVAVDHGERDPRVSAHVGQPLSGDVHVDEQLVVTQQIPGGGRNGLAVAAGGGDDGRVGPTQHLSGVVGERC